VKTHHQERKSGETRFGGAYFGRVFLEIVTPKLRTAYNFRVKARGRENMSVRNPMEWSIDHAWAAARAAESIGATLCRVEVERDIPLPAVARIGIADLRDALAKGMDDFAANRTEVILLCIYYPLIGIVLGRMASGGDTLPLLFPLVSGFALVGPIAAAGLYEMSRRRELGLSTGWAGAVGLLSSHALRPMAVLSVMFFAMFVVWLVAAQRIYSLTIGLGHTGSIGSFIHALLETNMGWALIVIGTGVGFVFATVVLTVGVVSVPMVIDRDVGVSTALRTSIRATAANPTTMAVWGLIVAAALVVGSIPVFLGLVIVLPVLGHSTWHLYRKLLPR
jgi:uncharacterized membrane protein